MENHLVLTTSGPWYEFFYNLAFLVGLGVLLFEAHKRKIPILKWVILLIITRILFITGTKLVTFRYDDWIELFTRFRLPPAPGKSLPGGLLFGMVGWIAGSYFLRFRHNTADAFAVALPLGIAIQRFGCFFAGCCFGKTGSLPWSVQYPANTLAHYHQFNAGLLDFTNAVSLPVHPVQLYEAAGMIAAVFVLCCFRKSFKKTGSMFMLSLMLMFAVRFISEFFRDVNAHVIGGRMTGIFNTTQFVLLPVLLILLVILVLREKPAVRRLPKVEEDDLLPAHALLILVFMFVLFLTFKNWFDMTERAVIVITFLVAFAFPAVRLISRFSRNPYRWLYPAGLILPFFLLAQTYRQDVQDSLLVKKYKTLKVGFGTGNFTNSHTMTSGSGCDRYIDTQYFQQEYQLGAAAFEISEEIPDKMQKFSYGAKAVFGNQQERNLESMRQENFLLVDVSPYVNYERNWVGIGGGLHIGKLNFITEDLSESGTGLAKTGNTSAVIYPQAYMRVGPRRWFFVDYRLADHFPSALPGYRQQLGVGTGLGMRNFASLRFGSNMGSMTYLSGYFPVGRLVVEPTFFWGDSPYRYYQVHNQFSLGVSYRFGMKEETRARQVTFY